MLLFKRVADLQKYIKSLKTNAQTIGFAPTMGALHSGHTSLVHKAKETCDVAVASIFVNPTQFNDPKDLLKYPRTPERDLELLAESGCDIVFMPDVSEVYPHGNTPSVKYDFGKLERVLEGEFRPGHFDGMAQVVSRLLDIVQPHQLFMGQKDFQQLAIVARMLTIQKSKIELISCPIIREKDGLAMSSRNVRLTESDRALAPLIYQTLEEAADKVEDYSPAEIARICATKLKLEPRLKLEYFEIVDGRTLLAIRTFENTDYAVALTAVWVGDVRLIDNKILKQTIVLSDLEE
ncbi:MAG: pantoate--beta-alanine ligase [Saprospiraceae bacterium]|nr:pantoate--beta-alanine ligase [Saprospiraceae bacterium]